MKPLHGVLLIVGAALAGGLAVKMTQPQPVSVASAPAVAAPQPVASAAPQAYPAPDLHPQRKAALQVVRVPETVESAPPPVYVEAPKPVSQPVRKNKPILLAKTMPTFLPPAPYEAPAPAPAPEKPVEQAAPAPALPNPTPEPRPAAQPELPPLHQVTLGTGTTLQIRLNESLSSDRATPGDTFDASLAEPLIVEGLVIAERGARVKGRIVESEKAGRFSGTSLLELELSSLSTADGQKVSISSDPWTKRGESVNTPLGAIVGVIAGGGKPVNVSSNTVIRFRLASRVTIKERRL
jgi:hypothetical protein